MQRDVVFVRREGRVTTIVSSGDPSTGQRVDSTIVIETKASTIGSLMMVRIPLIPCRLAVYPRPSVELNPSPC